MVHLLNIVIFHGYVTNNQRVDRDVYTGDFIGQPSSIPIWSSNIASYQNPPVINDVPSEKLQLAMFDGDFPAHKQSFFGDFARHV